MSLDWGKVFRHLCNFICISCLFFYNENHQPTARFIFEQKRIILSRFKSVRNKLYNSIISMCKFRSCLRILQNITAEIGHTKTAIRIWRNISLGNRSTPQMSCSFNADSTKISGFLSANFNENTIFYFALIVMFQGERKIAKYLEREDELQPVHSHSSSVLLCHPCWPI